MCFYSHMCTCMWVGLLGLIDGMSHAFVGTRSTDSTPHIPTVIHTHMPKCTFKYSHAHTSLLFSLSTSPRISFMHTCTHTYTHNCTYKHALIHMCICTHTHAHAHTTKPSHTRMHIACDQPVCSECRITGDHVGPAHVTVSLEDAFITRLNKMQIVLDSSLSPKKSQLLHQMQRLQSRVDSVHANKARIEVGGERNCRHERHAWGQTN